jgi:putative CGCGG family rSAM target protein
MYKEVATLKPKDWSLNLEDPHYEEHVDEIFTDSIAAIKQTAEGCYVNLVTPGKCGDPNEWLIAQLADQLKREGVPVKEIRYIDECGCGGFVTRVFR